MVARVAWGIRSISAIRSATSWRSRDRRNILTGGKGCEVPPAGVFIATLKMQGSGQGDRCLSGLHLIGPVKAQIGDRVVTGAGEQGACGFAS